MLDKQLERDKSAAEHHCVGPPVEISVMLRVKFCGAYVCSWIMENGCDSERIEGHSVRALLKPLFEVLGAEW